MTGLTPQMKESATEDSAMIRKMPRGNLSELNILIKYEELHELFLLKDKGGAPKLVSIFLDHLHLA